MSDPINIAGPRAAEARICSKKNKTPQAIKRLDLYFISFSRLTLLKRSIQTKCQLYASTFQRIKPKLSPVARFAAADQRKILETQAGKSKTKNHTFFQIRLKKHRCVFPAKKLMQKVICSGRSFESNLHDGDAVTQN